MSQFWATIRLPSISAAKLDFYVLHSNSAPLTIIGDDHNDIDSRALERLAPTSHRWRNLSVHVDDGLEGLDTIYQRIPLLEFLDLYSMYDNATSTVIFQDAPSLHRVSVDANILTRSSFDVMLPWHQLTFLTLDSLFVSLFSQFLRLCPQLLYFKAGIKYAPREPWGTVGMMKAHTSLHKLVLVSSSYNESSL
ncbi:F-box domain-containing protein [Mycena sanguinolenta]|uniref:F-box domain-containing protein n=1 Tax=Mycena sanguinolenta TaxID=230812 RepID=A0A8H7DC48_9AGAR|nr:F-box domain-containing protein [Mycena sanguinolenta]